MTGSVTDVIVARSRQAEDLRTMVWWSIGGHALLLALMIVWPLGPSAGRVEQVMRISLGGAPGPRTGGLTQIGARPVQAPPPETDTRRAVTPPAPVQPKMTLPDPKSKPRAAPKPDRAPPQSASRKLSTGAEPADGNARAETAVKRGQGFGLSSAGGAGGPVQVDVADFCCQEYLTQLVSIITRSWDQNQGVVGSTGVKFTILRDGTIQAPSVETPSGFIALDSAALRAVQLATLPPLPAAYQYQTLPVHLRFDYQR